MEGVKQLTALIYVQVIDFMHILECKPEGKDSRITCNINRLHCGTHPAIDIGCLLDKGGGEERCRL